MNYFSTSGVLRFSFVFFFFLMHAFQFLGNKVHYSCTVYALFMRPTTTLFRRKKILKMSPTVLFTHLKFILLQYFQFSVK